MSSNTNNNSILPSLGVKISLCFLLLIQLFPPLWVQDVTSLRHFFISSFDILSGVLFTTVIFKKNVSFANPFKFKPIIIWFMLIVWMAISIIWAINKVESIAVLNRWIVVFLSAVFTSVMLTDNSKVFHTLVYCTVIITFVNVLTCIIGYYHFDLHISQRRNLMLNGGYGNKNIFAVCLLLKLPLLYYAIVRYKRVWKIISLILVASVCFCLIILSTRSTFIGLFMQIIILFVYALFAKFRFKRSNKYVLSLLAVIFFAFLGFFAGNGFIKYNYNKYADKNVQNNYTVSARVKTIEEGNSKGRLIIWHNTAEIIRMNPVLGYGVGNHKLNIMRVEAKKKLNYIVSDHAHNDFLEMQSELGIIGEILYILLYVSMFVIGIKLMYNRNTKEPYRLIALAALLMLVTYMNDALFNFPLERATPQIYLALSVALMMFALFKSSGSKNTVQIKHPVPLFCVFAIILSATCYIETTHFVSSVVQRQRILCSNSGNKKNIPASHWENAAPWLPNIDESTKPIAVNNAKMYAQQGDYRKAIDLILADDSNPFYALKEYRLASYYARIKMTDSAFYWADKCISMKPLCYDPVKVKVNVYQYQKDTLSQIKVIEEYLTRETKEERAWIDLIDICLQQKNYDAAERYCLKALKYNEDNTKIINKKQETEELKKQKTSNN